MRRRPSFVLLLVFAFSFAGGAIRSAPTPAADCTSGPPGQIEACGGQFWVDGAPILLHGLDVSGISQSTDMTEEDYATISSWHMNVVRMVVNWSQFEPDPPDESGGIWTHHWHIRLVPKLRDQIEYARSHGIAVLLENRCFCGLGWPSWVGEAQYNSHGINYDLSSRRGRLDFLTNYWSDDLLKQFTMDWITNLVGWVDASDGILGYEPLDEPSSGYLPATPATTKTVLDWQLELAGAVRALDPNRVVFFTTHGSSGLGFPQADLSDWVALGNVAFDVHDFFGARWGSGLDLSDPSDPSYGERSQNMFDFTLLPTAPPYLGTVDGQARFVESFTGKLTANGIPLFMGEFGGNSDTSVPDPNILTLFGTMTQAFNQEGVSWTGLSYDIGIHSIFYPDGSLRPWAGILCTAAAYPEIVTDCPPVP